MLQILYLHKQLRNDRSKESLKNTLFSEFENFVDQSNIIDLGLFENESVIDMINESVESSIRNVVAHIIDSYISLPGLKHVKSMAKSFEFFFNNSNFGTFEHIQKTGKNIFRVEHSMGINGNEFLQIFFVRIFEIHLKNYSYSIISSENCVAIIFR